MFCAECGANEMELTDGPINEVFKDHEYVVEGISHWECPECGAIEYPAESLHELDLKLNELYRQQEGLMSPIEIRQLRKRLGITQVQLEQMIGVKSPAVSRWESGAVIQSVPANNCLRHLQLFECVQDYELQRIEASNDIPAAAAV